MTDLICYNCNAHGHIALHCPEPQRQSRCPTCNKVNTHDEGCPNKNFTSEQRFKSTTVFTMKNLLKIEFQSVTGDFFVHDVKSLVPIGNVPLWISTIDAFVGKINKSIEFATSHPMKRHVTIYNENKQIVLSLVFYEKMLYINGRFQIDNKGVISYNSNDENSVTEKIVCKIGIKNTEEVFKFRVTWHGHKHVFKFYPNVGAVNIDPCQPIEVQQPKPPADANAIALNVLVNQNNDSNEGAVGGSDRTFTIRLNLPDFNRSVVDDQFLGNLLRSTIANLQIGSPAIGQERGAIEEDKENRTQ